MSEIEYKPDAKRHLPVVAEITDVNVDLLKGYFVVGLLIDGSITIAHNVGCASCMVDHLVHVVKDNPDLACPTVRKSRWFRKV